MPEEITPSDGQEVNNTPPNDEQQTGSPDKPSEGPPNSTTLPPPQPPDIPEDPDKKNARIKQLTDLGFTESNGVYTKTGDFGEAIPESDILFVPDETWDAEIAKLQQETEAEPEETEPEEIKHPEFDYTGKIRLSATDFDAVDIKLANKAIKNSDVTQHDKEVLLGQIKDGKLEYAYAEMLRMILSADRQGQRYSGHL